MNLNINVSEGGGRDDAVPKVTRLSSYCIADVKTNYFRKNTIMEISDNSLYSDPEAEEFPKLNL